MKEQKGRELYGIREDDSGIACSAQECTGLIPSLPEDEDMIEQYEELFPYMAKALKEKGRNIPKR